MSDYIKREDAVAAILALEDRDIPEDRYPDTEFAFNEGLVHAASEVNAIPAADVVERKRGRWKGAGMGDYYCSICQRLMNPRTNFCPNCGADMRQPMEES